MKWNELKRQALNMVSYLISTAASTTFMLMKKKALPCNLKDTEQQKQKRA